MIIDKLREYIQKKIFSIAEMESKNVATALLHQKTFSQFKGMCTGKKLVICAPGPSINKYQPIKDAVHIALNRAFLYDKVNFDFIFAQDWDGIKMVKDDLISYNPDTCVKLLGSTMFDNPKEIPESFAIACKALRFNVDTYIVGDGYKSKFVRDIDYRPLGCMPNVGISVLQFALFLNPSELFIVGCDMSGGHFSNGTNSNKQVEEEKKWMDNWWKQEAEKMRLKWNEFKEFAHLYYPDTKIYSINPVGLRGLFEDIYQN